MIVAFRASAPFEGSTARDGSSVLTQEVVGTPVVRPPAGRLVGPTSAYSGLPSDSTPKSMQRDRSTTLW